MTDTQLEYLVEVVHSGSINKAAKRMFTSQSTISTALKNLEYEFHHELFVRSKKGIVLTDYGRQLYEYAADFLKKTYALKSVQPDLPDLSALSGNIPLSIYNGFTPAISKVTWRMLEQHNRDFLPLFHYYDLYDSLEALSSGSIAGALLPVPKEILQSERTRNLLEEYHLQYEILMESNFIFLMNPQHKYSSRNELSREEIVSEPILGTNNYFQGFPMNRSQFKLHSNDFYLLCDYLRYDAEVIGIVDKASYNMHLDLIQNSLAAVSTNTSLGNAIVLFTNPAFPAATAQAEVLVHHYAGEIRTYLQVPHPVK